MFWFWLVYALACIVSTTCVYFESKALRDEKGYLTGKQVVQIAGALIGFGFIPILNVVVTVIYVVTVLKDNIEYSDFWYNRYFERKDQ